MRARAGRNVIRNILNSNRVPLTTRPGGGTTRRAAYRKVEMKRDRFATLRGAIEGPLQRAVIALSRLKRGMTLGVRALVIDPERRMFLV